MRHSTILGGAVNENLDVVMARIWKEEYNPEQHKNQMWGAGWRPGEGELPPNREWVYFVHVCSFTFEFHSLRQVEACLEFYSTKILPDSRFDIEAADHWEVQSWQQRLPLYLRQEAKRHRVVKALTKALIEFSKPRKRRRAA